MKRRLMALALALCLLASVVSMALAEEPGGAAALPGVGDVVNGFEVIETREDPLLDAVIVRFEHQKTGAELYYIANDDTNRAFNLAFRTEAIDNTGLPHVFEHATIQGSKKYPGEQMFFNLGYQTYNTYLNAETWQWFTNYPIASLSEAQLLKLAEFYTDACFYPIIMESERIFRTEAWRYRMETPEDDLTLEGTVYSEMLGSMTLQQKAEYSLHRAAFPGSMSGNNFGGDPDCIPDMTWQALKDYHDRYYHPSNSVAYLYGQFEDYAAFLRLLDGYYSDFERREFSREDAGYTPIAESVVQSQPFPVEQGSNTEHASTVYYAFLCPGLRDNLEQELILDTMTDLFADSASDFQQRLRETLPYGGFGAYIDMSGPEDIIAFFASNVEPDDAETFKAIVDDEIAKVAQNGFPQALVDGVAASLEISARLTREGSAPVDSIIDPMLTRYIQTGNPWDHLDYQDALFRIGERNEQGLYAQAAADWLMGDVITVLSTTYPEPGAKEAHDAGTAEKLAAIKANMTEAEIQAVVAATNAEAPEDHSSEYVAQLRAVTVASLPEEWQHYEVHDETDADGIRHIEAPAAVDGISQANILLDAAGLPQEDIHWFNLYTNMIGGLDTAEHTRAELANLWSRYLYGGSIYPSIAREGANGYHPRLRMAWIALDDDLAAGYDLMRELVYDTKVDDPAKLLEQVQALKAGYKSGVTADPANTLYLRALARALPLNAYHNYIMGLDYYDFLGRVEQLLQSDPDAAIRKLEGIKNYFNNRTNAVTLCAGNEASIELNRQLSDAFLASLDAREIAPAEYDFPVPEKREAIIIDRSVQDNLLMGGLDAAGLEAFDGGLATVSKLVADTFLVPLLRDQYGVYTPWNNIYEDYFEIYAFQDPNIAETFAVMEQLPELISTMELDQETLDGYIMNAYSGYAMPQGALSGPLNAALNTLEGLDPDRYLEHMRQLKRVTPDFVREAAALYANLCENGARMTAGAASAINANADQFDAILNPFGAVDRTQVALADVPEGSEHYEAARFAFENGLMGALDGETFGVDEAATRGDVLAALNVFIGGELDAEAALQTFAEYGLVPADANLSEGASFDALNSLIEAIADAKIPLPEPADPAAMTRGELAEALKALEAALEEMEG